MLLVLLCAALLFSHALLADPTLRALPSAQLSHPEQWQRAALGSHSMVSVPSQLGLPAAYLLGTAELAKAVLAGEGDITLQGVQRNYGFATLVGQHSLLMVQEPRHKVGEGFVLQSSCTGCGSSKSGFTGCGVEQ